MGQAQRDAAGGWRYSRLSDVHENGAPPPSNAGALIVAHHHNHIVKMVVAPQVFGASRVRMANLSVIVTVGRIVAPPISHAQRRQRQMAARSSQAIGAVKRLAEHEGSDRSGAIPLPLICAAARPAKRARKPQVSTNDDANGCSRGQAPHDELYSISSCLHWRFPTPVLFACPNRTPRNGLEGR